MPDNSPIRILLVDDQAAVRQGLRMRLGLEPDLRVVGEAADGLAALSLVRELAPDVILLDLAMPLVDGFSVLIGLAETSPSTRAVILTLYDNADARARAGVLGAREFVSKSEPSDQLMAAIRQASQSARSRS